MGAVPVRRRKALPKCDCRRLTARYNSINEWVIRCCDCSRFGGFVRMFGGELHHVDGREASDAGKPETGALGILNHVNIPDTCGLESVAAGADSVYGKTTRAESREPRAREPRAESREPRAESREPRAREPRAESREPRAWLRPWRGSPPRTSSPSRAAPQQNHFDVSTAGAPAAVDCIGPGVRAAERAVSRLSGCRPGGSAESAPPDSAGASSSPEFSRAGPAPVAGPHPAAVRAASALRRMGRGVARRLFGPAFRRPPVAFPPACRLRGHCGGRGWWRSRRC